MRLPEPTLTGIKESHADLKATVDDAALPPVMFGLSLLEVYFSHIYNASLLFLKTKLLQDYVQGQVPAYLLRSIFALSTM